MIPAYKQGSEYDPVIQFWLDYWRAQGLPFPDGIDALLIKAMISFESRFDPNAKSTDHKSTASGLMQVTNQALRALGGFPNKQKWIEAKDHLIYVQKSDKNDPLVNVALGVRLLSHKFSQIPKRYPKDVRSTLIGYNQWNQKGEKYADEVLFRYKKALQKK
jgi:soluble lytic murein transglycosylase-like protein